MTTWQSLSGGRLSANMRGILLMIAATMLLTTDRTSRWVFASFLACQSAASLSRMVLNPVAISSAINKMSWAAQAFRIPVSVSGE